MTTTYSKDWYQKNKERIAAKRRERYRKDAEYREKARQRSRDYRERNPERVRQSSRVTRVLDGQRYEVFPIAKTAQELGRSPQTIRSWERKGHIPPTIFEGRNRVYTREQIELMRSLANVLEAEQHAGPVLEASLARLVPYIHDNWRNVCPLST